MTRCSVCGREVTRASLSSPWTACACANGPYLWTGADLNSAQHCGCDPGAHRICSDHRIEQLEHNLHTARHIAEIATERLASICPLAMEGMGSHNHWARQLFMRIFDLTKLPKETIS